MRHSVRAVMLLSALGIGELSAQAVAPLVLDSTTVRASSARTLADLLAGRVAGMGVTYASGIRGAAPQVRLRGAAGTQGAAEPHLYIDDVLIRDDQYWLGPKPDGHRPSFAWDLPVEEIESVTVIQGQSGGILLPFGAPRGAVLVRTRRPRDGNTRVRGSIESRSTTESTRFPSSFGREGTTSSGPTPSCTLSDEALGLCVPTTSLSANPLGDPALFRRGTGLRGSVSATGGLLAGAYRVAAVADREAGMVAPSEHDRLDLAAAFASDAARPLTFGVDARLTSASQQVTGWESILGIASVLTPADVMGAGGDVIASLRTPAVPIDARRLTLGAHVARKIGTGLRAEARVSSDVHRRESSTRREEPDPMGGAPLVREWSSESDARSWSAEAGVRSEHRVLGVRGELHALAFAGSTELDDSTSDMLSRGTVLSFESIARRATITNTGLSVVERLRFGASGQRLIGVGVRASGPSLAAWDLQQGLGHLLEGAWDVTSESFFPRVASLDRLRVHAAHGTGADLEPLLGTFASDLQIVFGSGSDIDRAPRIAETEVGVSSGWLGGRVVAEARAFRRQTTDLPLVIALPANAGFLFGIRGGNAVRTAGDEFRVALNDLRAGPLTFSSSASLSRMRERVTDFNGGGTLSPTGQDGGFVLTSVGTAIGEYPARDIEWSDANGDGIVDATEVVIGNMQAGNGSTRPTRLVAVSGAVAWGLLSVGTVLDGQYGGARFDADFIRRCRLTVCAELYDPATSLADQARAVASRYLPGYTGPVRSGGFTRVRELWLRIELPARLVPEAIGSARLTLAGHQVAVWSGDGGLDPEVGRFVGPSIQRNAHFNQPIVPTWSLRLDLGR